MRQLCQSSPCSSLPAFTPAEWLWGLPGGLCSHHLHPPSPATCCGCVSHQLEPCGTDGCQRSPLMGAHGGRGLQTVPAHWVCGSGCLLCPSSLVSLPLVWLQAWQGTANSGWEVLALQRWQGAVGIVSLSPHTRDGEQRCCQGWYHQATLALATVLGLTLQPTRNSLRQRMR